MKLIDKHLTFSLVFNIGFGFMKSRVGIKNECRFKSKMYILPFLVITYTETYMV
jgi:hypothetical protein